MIFLICECKKISHPVRVDGVFNKPEWVGIPSLPAFRRAEDGEPAERRTEVKICWDNQYLYVVFDCDDPDIWGSFQRRDDPIFKEEVVEIFISPGHDLENYLEFEISPRNVVFDAKIYNSRDGVIKIDTGWDCEGMITAVTCRGTLDDRTDTDEGWTAEFAIPFKEISKAGAPSKGDEWLVNFYRIDRTPRDEFSCWSPTLVSPANFHIPARFGKLKFI